MNNFRKLLCICSLLSSSLLAQAQEQAIDLKTATGQIKGSLLLPESANKPPVALIIAGSGPTDRDGNNKISGVNNSYKMLAQALKDIGIASLRYDKRGYAASQEAAVSEASLSFEDYITDAQGWIELLAQDSRFSKVIVIGHSEGSLIGMLAAQRAPAAAYVSLAGAADRLSTTLRTQLRGQLPSELAARSEAILSDLEQGKQVSDAPPALAMLFRPSVQPYLISLFKYTPSQEIARLKSACLILQGDTDLQISVADGDKLAAANPACVYKKIAGMNHVLKSVPAERQAQLASYSNPELALAPELIHALRDFLQDQQGLVQTVKPKSP